MISLSAWDRLPEDLRTVVREAARAEHTLGLADAHERNAAALVEILGRSQGSLEAFPRAILEAARKASAELIPASAHPPPLARRIVDSYTAAANDMRGWS